MIGKLDLSHTETITKSALELDKIIRGDCLEVLKTFPDESVDLIFTSPPYADNRKTHTKESPLKSM